MWIKKIEDFFESATEYDNGTLSLHFAIDFIEVLKERVEFVCDDGNFLIYILPYDGEEKTEVDTEGFMYWCQFTFHKELIDVLLKGKEDLDKGQNDIKQLQNVVKSMKDEDKKKDSMNKLGDLAQDANKIEIMMNKVDTYRQNCFEKLSNLKLVESLITDVRILKEQAC